MEPFLKWPGGKRWLLAVRPQIFEEPYERYIEPFVGGGAVFFSLEPNLSVLGDINRDLISMYLAVRDGWNSITHMLAEHHERHCEKYYYRMRSNVPRSRFERAARFIYLNRTCWNGLYRVNLRGEFNVPIGTKTSVVLPSDDFERAAKLLSDSELISGDFERTISRARKGDLVFVDPPYVAEVVRPRSRRHLLRCFERRTYDEQAIRC